MIKNSFFELYNSSHNPWLPITWRRYFTISTMPYWLDISMKLSYTTVSVIIIINRDLLHIVIPWYTYDHTALGTGWSWEKTSETWNHSPKRSHSKPCESTYTANLSAHHVATNNWLWTSSPSGRKLVRTIPFNILSTGSQSLAPWLDIRIWTSQWSDCRQRKKLR